MSQAHQNYGWLSEVHNILAYYGKTGRFGTTINMFKTVEEIMEF